MRARTKERITQYIKTRHTCRMCGKPNLEMVWSFGKTPLANAYVNPHANNEETFAPLRVFHCNNCHLTQLLDIVSPKKLFHNYLYASSTSPVFRKHFKDYADQLVSRFKLTYRSLVVDIGSNDGILLQPLRSHGVRILGIEPAETVARIANKFGLTTVTEYFSKEVAERLKSIHGAAHIITANNVFAHTDAVHEFTDAVRDWLDDKGVFIFEVQYLGDLMKKNLFDIIYHEHLCYYHVTPMIPFFQQHGMNIFDVLKTEAHGGSLRVFVAKKGASFKRTEGLKNILNRESKDGLNTIDKYRKFSRRIERNKIKLMKILSALKKKNKRIAGYGAPAKATTLCYTLGIDRNTLDYIVDDSELKQGMLMPGTHIPIVSSKRLYEDKPDYCLILAWNFAYPIMENHRQFSDRGGKFIIPVPTPRII